MHACVNSVKQKACLPVILRSTVSCSALYYLIFSPLLVSLNKVFLTHGVDSVTLLLYMQSVLALIFALLYYSQLKLDWVVLAKVLPASCSSIAMLLLSNSVLKSNSSIAFYVYKQLALHLITLAVSLRNHDRTRNCQKRFIASILSLIGNLLCMKMSSSDKTTFFAIFSSTISALCQFSFLYFYKRVTDENDIFIAAFHHILVNQALLLVYSIFFSLSSLATRLESIIAFSAEHATVTFVAPIINFLVCISSSLFIKNHDLFTFLILNYSKALSTIAFGVLLFKESVNAIQIIGLFLTLIGLSIFTKG